MDIVDKIASYARAVPAGLKAAGQELAKTASAIAGDDAPAAPRRTSSRRPAAKRKTVKRAKPKAKSKQQPKAKAKRAAGKKRKAKR